MYNKAIKMTGLLLKFMVCFVLFLFLCVKGRLFADPHILLSGSPSLCVGCQMQALGLDMQDNCPGPPEALEHSRGHQSWCECFSSAAGAQRFGLCRDLISCYLFDIIAICKVGEVVWGAYDKLG